MEKLFSEYSVQNQKTIFQELQENFTHHPIFFHKVISDKNYGSIGSYNQSPTNSSRIQKKITTDFVLYLSPKPSLINFPDNSRHMSSKIIKDDSLSFQIKFYISTGIYYRVIITCERDDLFSNDKRYLASIEPLIYDQVVDKKLNQSNQYYLSDNYLPRNAQKNNRNRLDSQSSVDSEDEWRKRFRKKILALRNIEKETFSNCYECPCSIL